MQPALTAPLPRSQQRFVGVILNLAVFFAYHVLCGPRGRLAGRFELDIALIALGAGTPHLFRYKAQRSSRSSVTCAIVGIDLKP